VKASSSLKNEFETSCKQLGIIGGKNIKRQLVGLVSELPEILSCAAKLIKDTVPAQKQYSAFSNFVLNKDTSSTWTPMLAYIAGKLN
jgi:hypothetical protein